MGRLRGLLSVVFALMACFLVSCSGPSAVAPPPTYSEAQLQQIQQYLPDIQDKFARMDNLAKAIQQSNWQEIATIMRGPLGQMIQDMRNVNRHLLPSDQKAAQELTRTFFEDFVAIDQSATNKNAMDASKYYDEAVRDFEKDLSRLPEMPEIADEISDISEEVSGISGST
jgi:photosystem II protein PsbQ